MLTEQGLKQQLRTIVDHHYSLPAGTNAFELAQSMLVHIGTVDPELRDNLIYTTLSTWILQNIFTPDQLGWLLARSMDEQHLFYRIGEQGTDTVFTRSFSVLLLPPLLLRHRQQPFLSRHDVITIQQNIIRYLDHEQDRRGYVEHKGWAHSVAHAADVIDEVVQCHEVGPREVWHLLDVLQRTVATTTTVYMFGEDERCAAAASAALRHSPQPDAWILEWLQGFVTLAHQTGAIPARYTRLTNIKAFLHSLYVRARRDELSSAVWQRIESIVTTMSGA